MFYNHMQIVDSFSHNYISQENSDSLELFKK